MSNDQQPTLTKTKLDPAPHKITAVIPCYCERNQILGVINKFDSVVTHIIIIDDACPEKTGEFVLKHNNDERVQVITHEKNQGVGGATITGYRKAIELGSDIIVKVDGDGQMDPTMIQTLIGPIQRGEADYAKANRFYRLKGLAKMPLLRLVGNLLLSFVSKMSSGYWKIFDPTNGFTAIHGKVAQELPLDQLHKGYFFESDMLFQLNMSRAVVVDVPIPAIYGNEKSSLNVSKILLPFSGLHLKNFFKRILYSYFLHDFSIASIELITGLIFVTFGSIFGGIEWYESSISGVTASSGTVIIAALPLMVGSQLLISFLNFDVNNQPNQLLYRNLK